MGNTYIGTSRLKKVFLGGSKVRRIYLGTNKIFSGTPEFTYGGVTYTMTDEQVAAGYQVILPSNGTVNFTSFDSSTFRLTVCVIGGGGAGGGGHHNGDDIQWGEWGGGGGAEGGEVKSSRIYPSENTNYGISIGGGATSIGGTGGTTTAFGISSLGGIGGGTSTGANYGAGGSGRGGADGGRGHYHKWDAWGHETNVPFGTHDAGAGSNGTVFNGTYYAGGGGGFTGAGNTWNGAGQSNYGGGGMGANPKTLDTRHYGKNGAVILLFQNA